MNTPPEPAWLEWIRSLRPPVLVVGNAVLRSPVPNNVYSSVIRINNYELGGWSGTQVTHWAANGYQDIEPRPISPVLVPWSEELQTRRGNNGKVFRSRNPVIIHPLRDTHIRWYFPRAAECGRPFPSTGFCLLSLLILNGVTPDLAGFDGFRTGHQGNPDWKHGHAPGVRAREWAVLQSWKLFKR